MRFAHIADVHIGGWRDEAMRKVTSQALVTAIDECIKRKVDFVLIAGDLFNTALPCIDKLKLAAAQLNRLREQNIMVYVIPGSHDYSPTGRTMIDVFEKADLLTNVFKGEVELDTLRLKFTKSPDGTLITGVPGRAGMLDSRLYKKIDIESLESMHGRKIFLFHTSIKELQTNPFNAESVSVLPKGFMYYAGGHIHIKKEYSSQDHSLVVYPGPLYPNNFAELSELKEGSFCIYENGSIQWISIRPKMVHSISLDLGQTTPNNVQSAIDLELDKDFKDSIVLIDIKGILETGGTSDIDWNTIMETAKRNNAYTLLRNTAGLVPKEYKETMQQSQTIKEIEEQIISEHVNQSPMKVNPFFIKQILNLLDTQRGDGESVNDFEVRVYDEIKTYLGLSK